MAWTHVTYKCGHEDRVQMYGPYRQRAAEVERLGTRLCPACYTLERDHALQQRAEQDRGRGIVLPDLTGSPAQVRWATSIRQDWLTTTLARIPAGHPDAERTRAVLCAAASTVLAAHLWIEQRFRLDHMVTPAVKAALAAAES